MRFFKKTADKEPECGFCTAAQPPHIRDQADQPVLPDEKAPEETEQQTRDYLIQRGWICTAADPPDIRDQADRHVPLDYTAQPPDNPDQVDQPVLPDEKVLEETKQQDRDFLIQNAMKKVQEVNDHIFKINELILNHVPGGKWLSPDVLDVRDRLVEAKKPIAQMLKELTEPDPNVQEDEGKLLVRGWSFLVHSQKVCLESDRFLGK